ncbi:MAG: class I SAM-dependent methyltransferase, partial [Verrucomicrobiota bacterium]|nr:class I SAM-dependent methyltransferase [Verrucomicrobiota bacterium]
MRDSEKIYEIVYGKTFGEYELPDLEEVIHPLEVRFERNGLSPDKVFSGKRCLDAGCGNGRGAFFMLRHGAAWVEAIDVSENNVASTRRFAEELGYGNHIKVARS